MEKSKETKKKLAGRLYYTARGAKLSHGLVVCGYKNRGIGSSECIDECPASGGGGHCTASDRYYVRCSLYLPPCESEGPQAIILKTVGESIDVKRESIKDHMVSIIALSGIIAAAIKEGNKLLIFGNGGSAADAQHMAAEFINRFQVERRPLPAIALTTDASVITSIGNDYSFEEIFSKQIMAVGQSGDIALGISTSGKSKNVIRALSACKERGIIPTALVGIMKSDMEVLNIIGHAIGVNSEVAARIQETHITIIHIICDLVDRALFPDKF